MTDINRRLLTLGFGFLVLLYAVYALSRTVYAAMFTIADPDFSVNLYSMYYLLKPEWPYVIVLFGLFAHAILGPRGITRWTMIIATSFFAVFISLNAAGRIYTNAWTSNYLWDQPSVVATADAHKNSDYYELCVKEKRLRHVMKSHDTRYLLCKSKYQPDYGGVLFEVRDGQVISARIIRKKGNKS